MASERLAIREQQRGRNAHRDAVRHAHLPCLLRHADCGPQHDQVHQRPCHIHHHRRGFLRAPEQQAAEPEGKAQHVDSQQNKIRLRNCPVEKLLLDLPALGGHVELAQLGVDEGHCGRQHDVPGQYRFINLGPERMPEPPLYPRVGDICDADIRQHIGRNLHGGRVDHMQLEIEVRDRHGQEDQPWNAIEEMQHGVAVADPLEHAQPLAEQWVVDPEDLRHATRPADALADVAGQAFGCETSSLHRAQICRVVAEPVQLEGSVRVLGNGFYRDATDFQ